MYKITCPYCFETFDDAAVLFRSEFVNRLEQDEIPNEEDRMEARVFSPVSFGGSYRTPYEAWWSNADDMGGNSFDTSERDPEEKRREADYLEPFRRPVIDPKEPFWQKYLVVTNPAAPEGDPARYLVRGKDKMVSGIKLRATRLHPEMSCSRRVCPYCNNPLPNQFGKAPVITIPIIGVTGSGKTVYMSSLLNHIDRYMRKVGFNKARANGSGTYAFQEQNRVEAGKELPNPTPARVVQQPIIFDMTKDVGGNRISTYMVVLYDLAGEYFNNDAAYDISKEEKHRKKLLRHADGIILLIDPSQLNETDTFGYQGGGRRNNPAVTALNVIANVLIGDDRVESKVRTPLAVCIPKADKEEFLYFFDERTQELATQSAIYDVKDRRIPADQYNALTDALYDTLELNSDNGILSAANDYEMARVFAFSATGGAPIDEARHQMIGTPTPERLEDPLLWLLAKNGYCEVDGELSRDVRCPVCKSYYTRYKVTRESVRWHWYSRREEIVNHYICRRCGHAFNLEEER